MNRRIPPGPYADVSRSAGGAPAGTYDKGAPIVAIQNARLFGGYTGTTKRQNNPPSVAYLNNQARKFTLPLALGRRFTAPADKAEIYTSDPRPMMQDYQAKEDYFRNMHMRDLGGIRTNPERTPHGPGTNYWGKPYHPRGLTYRFLPSPSQNTADMNPPMPLYRGY